MKKQERFENKKRKLASLVSLQKSNEIDKNKTSKKAAKNEEAAADRVSFRLSSQLISNYAFIVRRSST